MKRAGGVLLGLLVAAGLALLGGAYHYRVVRTPWGTVLLEKPHPSFGGSYVDTRGWRPHVIIHHWELSKQLMERGLQRLQERSSSHELDAQAREHVHGSKS